MNYLQIWVSNLRLLRTVDILIWQRSLIVWSPFTSLWSLIQVGILMALILVHRMMQWSCQLVVTVRAQLLLLMMTSLGICCKKCRCLLLILQIWTMCHQISTWRVSSVRAMLSTNYCSQRIPSILIIWRALGLIAIWRCVKLLHKIATKGCCCTYWTNTTRNLVISQDKLGNVGTETLPRHTTSFLLAIVFLINVILFLNLTFCIFFAIFIRILFLIETCCARLLFIFYVLLDTFSWIKVTKVGIIFLDHHRGYARI